MSKFKILCLGNEFIKEDSFAKEIGGKLASDMKNLDFISINHSFQLVDLINSDKDFLILDVVKGLNDVRIIRLEDLKENRIINSHDFDSQFFLKLIGDEKKIKIIGIPSEGASDDIIEKTKILIKKISQK
ncbi:MAG: hypothetical protein Q8N99_06745 [Nanoarchaeota archaeon]|nr:hypothetical protein [Nanoarchaeota archaeon]